MEAAYDLYFITFCSEHQVQLHAEFAVFIAHAALERPQLKA